MLNKEPNTDTLANNLANQIRGDIAKQDLHEGMLFMTGDEVCAQYGISRGIAREAISQLRALGVLKSRQGKGLIIGKPDLVELFERGLPFYGKMTEDLRILVQLRYVLEIGSVDLAIKNALDNQVRELGDLADEFRRLIEVPEPVEQEVDKVEFAFHSLILKMTDNPIISGMHTVLSEYFERAAESSLLASPSSSQRQVNAWEHEAIAEGFLDRDLETVRAYLRRHLKWVIDGSSLD